MASAKDIISRALKACGGVFRPSMDEEKTSGNKSLFKVTPTGSDEVVYSFRVKIDKKKYQSLTNPGEGAGAEGVPKAEQTAQDEAIALDANQAVQQAMRECAATIEQCRARNKIACPYHGAKIIEMDIMQRLQNLGVNAVPKVEADKDRRGRPTGTYMIQIPCMDVRAERDKVERAINEFMQTPGVAPEEGRDAENDWTDDIHELEEGGSPAESGYTSFFEVDRLDPNASSEEEAHVEQPEDEEEDDGDEDGEENEAPETERNEEATPSVQEEPTTASERPENETAESAEENAPRAENGNREASGANQEVIDYLRGQLENENLPQSVRDFLQGQLDSLSPRGEESGETESPSEPREQIDWEEQARRDREFSDAIRNANWEPATSRTESSTETSQRTPEDNARAVRSAMEAVGLVGDPLDVEDGTRFDIATNPDTGDKIYATVNPNGSLRFYLENSDGMRFPETDNLGRLMTSNGRRWMSPQEEMQAAPQTQTPAAPQDRRAQNWEDMDPNTRAYWQARYNADNGDISDISDDQLERAHDVLGEEDPLFQAILDAYNSRRAAHRQAPVSANAVHAHAGETDPMLGDGNSPSQNQVEAQTRGQESAANAETPQQNTDARESRVLLRINNEHINDDISPDVMDALHAELRRASRRKVALFAESGRDQTSPAYAAGKRFSSYERALNTILRSFPSNYRELLDAVNDYARQIADSEETRRRPDGTTETVRGFNPETGAQTTPHKRAMDAANFIGHLFGLKAELNNHNGGVRFIPINDMNDLLPPLTYETSASHAAHRDAMRSAANANAQTTTPRPQPTRREFFAAPTGTEGRIDAGSDRANSIRANAQNASNSARSSRVRNILSRIARPQQQPEERLD